MKILLVEDDRFLGELLKESLTSSYYTVDLATDGEIGLELAQQQKYDLVILDIQLPKLDGLNVCRTLRSQGFATPILMLTTRSASHDITTGLDAGADDYLTKPCNTNELLARIRALLRRGNVEKVAPILSWGNLCLDPATAQVTYQQKIVPLRPKEYTLLELFLRSPLRIFSRDAIIDRLWTIDDTPSNHAVTNLIKDLRQRLNSAGMTEDLIETVYGIGYRVKPEPKNGANDGKTEDVRREEAEEGREKNEREAAAEQVPQGIANIQLSFKASLEERIDILQAAERSLQTGELSDEQRAIAQAESHRLSGSLGTFGYHRGSDLAKLLEYLLMKSSVPQKLLAARMNILLLELARELRKPPNTKALDTTAYPLVLLIGDDLSFADALFQEAVERKFQLEMEAGEKILDRLAEQKTTAVILMLGNSYLEAERLAILQSIEQQFPAIPTITLAQDFSDNESTDPYQESLRQRIQVARLGGDRFLPSQATPSQVFEAIVQTIPQPPKVEAKAMVVDDDPETLAYLTNLLQPWGMQVICLENSSQFWHVLTTTQPDLLLLDLEMPIFSGLELCLAVRQDPKYSDLPILMLTDRRGGTHPERNRATRQQVFDAGADDLICKPVDEPELINLVLTRIERVRLHQHQVLEWQRQSTIDALTRLTNRRSFHKILQQKWQQFQLEQLPLSLILCGIDEFKPYNDSYGYPAGDTCLQQIASTLEQCLKFPHDRLARFGGDEFAILLPNTVLNAAIRVADRIQKAIALLQIPHSHRANQPYLTVSLGITSTVPDPEQPLDEFVEAADRALCAAKIKGRNTHHIDSL